MMGTIIFGITNPIVWPVICARWEEAYRDRSAMLSAIVDHPEMTAVTPFETRKPVAKVVVLLSAPHMSNDWTASPLTFLLSSTS